jgi:hypothetical protein
MVFITCICYKKIVYRNMDSIRERAIKWPNV